MISGRWPLHSLGPVSISKWLSDDNARARSIVVYLAFLGLFLLLDLLMLTELYYYG